MVLTSANGLLIASLNSSRNPMIIRNVILRTVQPSSL